MTPNLPTRVFILVALASLSAGLAACPAAERAPEREPVVLVGTWTSSTLSYEDAAASTQAVRLGADGVMIRGRWDGVRFVAEPGVGPSGPDFVMRYEVAGEVVTFLLDGAEEHARLTRDGPDRWSTHSGPPDDVVVYHVRRE